MHVGGVVLLAPVDLLVKLVRCNLVNSEAVVFLFKGKGEVDGGKEPEHEEERDDDDEESSELHVDFDEGSEVTLVHVVASLKQLPRN